jgi:hypothetical protein
MTQPPAFCAVMRAPEAAMAAAAPWARAEGVSIRAAGPLAAVFAQTAAAPGGAAALCGGKRARKAAGTALVARQRVLERLLAHGDALPAPPDAALAPEEARDALLANAALLSGALDGVSGRVQHQVLVSWDPAAALRRYADAPELAALREGASAGDIAAAGEALRARLGQAFAARIAAAADDAVALPLDGPERLINLACMTRRDALPGFEAALEAVDADWPEGLAIRMIGPTPPHSFAALSVRRVDAAAEAEACRALGVAPEQGAEAARRALRARALSAHPDAGGAGGDFSALTEAERMLRRLAEARAALGRGGAVALITLRREEGGDPGADLRAALRERAA